tara:strand:- start:53 stop:784 length:732 start_codon:yes stop_codon:yes gene_type:complete
MIAIFKKEILLFTKNKFGLLTICLLLLLYGLILFTNLFNLNILESGYADFGTFFSLSPIIFLLYIPAIAMRSFSEEFKNDTIDILISKPIPKFGLVMGKFLAIYFIIFLSIIPTLIYPITIYFIGENTGNLDIGSVIGSYIGLLFLCLAFTSISIFSSSLSKNQLNSFIIGVVLNLFFFYGFDIISQLFNSGQISLIIQEIGMFKHYELLSKGLISSSDIIYFLSISYIFLFFSKYRIEIKSS